MLVSAIGIDTTLFTQIMSLIAISVISDSSSLPPVSSVINHWFVRPARVEQHKLQVSNEAV